MPIHIDGSRDDDETYRKTTNIGRDWRRIAESLRSEVIIPEVWGDLDKNSTYGYRYLEPEHLVPPWTPALLYNVWGVHAVVSHYQWWDKPGPVSDPWWNFDLVDPALSCGEQILEVALLTFQEAGLSSWVEWTKSGIAAYRKRVAWSKVDATGWASFYVDINWPSIFDEIKNPADWQVVVDKMLGEQSLVEAKKFLQLMRMASIEGVQSLPPTYGVTSRIPSFGYRREHTTDHVFAGWAAATMPAWDLFGPKFWPSEG